MQVVLDSCSAMSTKLQKPSFVRASQDAFPVRAASFGLHNFPFLTAPVCFHTRCLKE